MSEPTVATAVIHHPRAPREIHFRRDTSDEPTIAQIFGKSEYAVAERLRRGPEIMAFLDDRSAFGRRPLIVDAGANIGASAVYFALTFPAARIVAIEPEEGNFRLLQRNVEGLDVRCIRAALAASPGYVRVIDPGEDNWGYRTEPAASGIPCVSVPDIYRQECGETVFPFLVKIDIEGAEADVFAGNIGWFDETPLVIVEPHDWLLPKRGTSRAFLQCIADKPRDFVIVGENIYSVQHELR